MDVKTRIIVGTIIEMVGVAVLTGMGIKSELEHSKTRKKLRYAELKNEALELGRYLDKIKIKKLEEELKKYKEEESE